MSPPQRDLIMSFKGDHTQRQKTKPNETKSQFIEQINKTDFSQIHQEKNERAQISKIRSENKESTTDVTEIQRIMRLLINNYTPIKMDNLEVIDKFLERYNLLRLNQEEIENMNRPVTITEIESII